MHLWNSLTLSMIWSLIPHVEQSTPLSPLPFSPLPFSPPPSPPRKGCPHLLWKVFKKRSVYVLLEDISCSYSTQYNVGVYAPSIFERKRGLKLVDILNLAKRIVWKNRSVGYSIVWNLGYCQLKPLGALHWDLTFSWSSFLSSNLNSIKRTVINIGWLSSHGAAKQQLKK